MMCMAVWQYAHMNEDTSQRVLLLSLAPLMDGRVRLCVCREDCIYWFTPVFVMTMCWVSERVAAS